MSNARNLATHAQVTLGGLASKSAVGSAEITDGAVATVDLADASVTPAKLSQPLTRGTAVAATSGTSIDFTSIPSWVKRIAVVLNQVSLSASDSILVRIGSGGTPASTGYVTAYGVISGTSPNNNNSTAGFIIPAGLNSVNSNFILTLVNIEGNTWVASGTGQYGTAASYASGSVTLSGLLNILRVTSSGGTATFDAGSINILYE